jgi:predicted dehydrogenase
LNLLIGTGQMAVEYAKVLTYFNAEFLVIGRGHESAMNFTEITGKKVENMKINEIIHSNLGFDKAIVCVDITQSIHVASDLIKAGVKTILLEKPGALSLQDLTNLHTLSDLKGAKVLIAYNRRFYESVKNLIRIANEDGGILEIKFDFSERIYDVEKLVSPEVVKNSWVTANSSHIIDLAFFLIGQPKILNSNSSGRNTWHPSSTLFNGDGISNKGIPFKYCADWTKSGNWRVEAVTKNISLVLQPIEILEYFDINSKKSIDKINGEDIDFKPGIRKQTQAFLNENTENFLTLKDQIAQLKVINKIANYKD